MEISSLIKRDNLRTLQRHSKGHKSEATVGKRLEVTLLVGVKKTPVVHIVLVMDLSDDVMWKLVRNQELDSWSQAHATWPGALQQVGSPL